MEVFRKVTEMPALTANVLIFVRAISNFFRQTHFNQWLLLNCSEVSSFHMIDFNPMLFPCHKIECSMWLLLNLSLVFFM